MFIEKTFFLSPRFSPFFYETSWNDNPTINQTFFHDLCWRSSNAGGWERCEVGQKLALLSTPLTDESIRRRASFHPEFRAGRWLKLNQERNHKSISTFLLPKAAKTQKKRKTKGSWTFFDRSFVCFISLARLRSSTNEMKEGECRKGREWN